LTFFFFSPKDHDAVTMPGATAYLFSTLRFFFPLVERAVVPRWDRPPFFCMVRNHTTAFFFFPSATAYFLIFACRSPFPPSDFSACRFFDAISLRPLGSVLRSPLFFPPRKTPFLNRFSFVQKQCLVRQPVGTLTWGPDCCQFPFHFANKEGRSLVLFPWV